MTKTDWTPDSQPVEDADPLSATGMFLSAFGKETSQPQKPAEPSFAPPAAEAKPAPWAAEPLAAPPVEAPQGPGEFTKMFQTTQAAPKAAAPAPVAPPTAPVEARQAPAPAPGEFTRIFVKPVEQKAAPAARAIPEPSSSSSAAPASSRMKGFSSGASDSASAEGSSFTQFFQPRSPAPASTPRVQAYTPPAAAPPVEEFKWPKEPDLGKSASPAPGMSGSNLSGSAAADANPSSATNLFASLGLGGGRPEESKPRPPESRPIDAPRFDTRIPETRATDTLPSFTPAPPPEPAAMESGSVTRLIQRLSETPRPAPEPPPMPVAPPPATDSGPGEFTRMINAASMKPVPAAPAPAPAPPPPPSAPPMAMPAITMPPLAAPSIAAPTAHLSTAPAAAPMPAVSFAAPALQPPRIEPPAAPKFAPAPAAPPSKMQEMVPMLLVVNTFLLLVLIVIVIFSLKGR